MTNSSTPQLIETHFKDVGGIPVRRALPGKVRRTIGAWCFLDHIGPAEQKPGAELNVGPHPHIGLQTFTWMIEGEIRHRDSLASDLVIRPGQVNLMTAGHGIAHSEEYEQGRILHAAQLWIALPKHAHNIDPAFDHYPTLPILSHEGFQLTLLAGEYLSEKAPTKIYTPLIGMDILNTSTNAGQLPLNAAFEYGFMCLEGSTKINGVALEPGTLLYLAPGSTAVNIESDSNTRILLVGGEPFEEDLIIWWNFVARTAEEIEKATLDWNAGRHFPDVPKTPLTRLTAPDVTGMQFKASR